MSDNELEWNVMSCSAKSTHRPASGLEEGGEWGTDFPTNRCTLHLRFPIRSLDGSIAADKTGCVNVTKIVLNTSASHIEIRGLPKAGRNPATDAVVLVPRRELVSVFNHKDATKAGGAAHAAAFPVSSSAAGGAGSTSVLGNKSDGAAKKALPPTKAVTLSVDPSVLGGSGVEELVIGLSCLWEPITTLGIDRLEVYGAQGATPYVKPSAAPPAVAPTLTKAKKAPGESKKKKAPAPNATTPAPAPAPPIHSAPLPGATATTMTFDDADAAMFAMYGGGSATDYTAPAPVPSPAPVAVVPIPAPTPPVAIHHPPVATAPPAVPAPAPKDDHCLKGCTIIISGYMDPIRSEIRDKALTMGAKYAKDWKTGCTHCVCVGPSTPKYHAVLGSGFGYVVSKDWVLDAFNLKRRPNEAEYAIGTGGPGFDDDELPAKKAKLVVM